MKAKRFRHLQGVRTVGTLDNMGAFLHYNAMHGNNEYRVAHRLTNRQLFTLKQAIEKQLWSNLFNINQGQSND